MEIESEFNRIRSSKSAKSGCRSGLLHPANENPISGALNSNGHEGVVVIDGGNIGGRERGFRVVIHFERVVHPEDIGSSNAHPVVTSRREVPPRGILLTRNAHGISRLGNVKRPGRIPILKPGVCAGGSPNTGQTGIDRRIDRPIRTKSGGQFLTDIEKVDVIGRIASTGSTPAKGSCGVSKIGIDGTGSPLFLEIKHEIARSELGILGGDRLDC